MFFVFHAIKKKIVSPCVPTLAKEYFLRKIIITTLCIFIFFSSWHLEDNTLQVALRIIMDVRMHRSFCASSQGRQFQMWDAMGSRSGLDN